MSDVKYSDLHWSWITENFVTYPTSSIMAREFEREFGIPITPYNMRTLCKRAGLRRNTQHRYSESEEQWLRENANTIPYNKLSDEFEKIFGVKVSKGGLNQHCIKIGIFSENPNEFNNRTPWRKYPIGTERLDKRYGCMLVKTEKGWINKARYLYEQVYGPIPAKHQVIFLDGDRTNYDLDNLYCIPLKYIYLLNINKWWGTSREVTLTGIEWCKLYYALKENCNSIHKNRDCS